MPGPELDIGTYIFSLQSFNNMIGCISLPPSYWWGTKPLEKESEVTQLVNIWQSQYRNLGISMLLILFLSCS